MTDIEKLTNLVLTSEIITVEMMRLAYAIQNAKADSKIDSEDDKKSSCITAEFLEALHKKLISVGMLSEDGIFTDPITGLRHNSTFDNRDVLALVRQYFEGTSMMLLAILITNKLGFCNEGGYRFVKLVINTYREVSQR